MGRKKIRPSERIVRVQGYVKRKHASRLKRIIDNEVKKIQLEDSTHPENDSHGLS